MLDINSIVYKLPIEVDSTRILNELDTLVLPYHNRDIKNNLKEIKAVNLSVTVPKNTPLDNWYNTSYNQVMPKIVDLDTGELLSKDYLNFNLGFPGPWRNNLEGQFSDGTRDGELVHWHPDLVGGEMFNLKNRIAEYLKVSDQMRCRASFIAGPGNIHFHSDPHTPWRVHVNLKSGPNTKWLFRNLTTNEIIEWKQPQNSVWLVRTGDIQHSVKVVAPEIRWQLFYHIRQINLGPNYHQIA